MSGMTTFSFGSSPLLNVRNDLSLNRRIYLVSLFSDNDCYQCCAWDLPLPSFLIVAQCKYRTSLSLRKCKGSSHQTPNHLGWIHSGLLRAKTPFCHFFQQGAAER